jgi:DNA mismatch repair protein MutS2
MRMVVPADQVEVIGGESPAAERTLRVGAPAERDLALVPMEIDLRGFRADEAEAAAVAALDAAVLAEHPHLRIIHGMGTGAVRERVQRVLRADRRVTRFGFAPARQGGTGVTVVEFGA